MSKEGSPELTKSWVFVDPEKQSNGDETSGVEEVTESEPHIDSDTDSISVISESGCSYRTDEEEFSPTEGSAEKEEVDNDQPEIPETKPELELAETAEPVDVEPRVIQQFDENKAIEKLLYFATSAACAIILVGFSVAVQHYFQHASNVNIFDPDQVVFPHVQNLKGEAMKESSANKFSLKRKSHLKLDELENKVAKLQEDSEFHDKILSLPEDNDLKFNNKPNKNAAVKSDKENCDVSEKRGKTHDLEKMRRHEANMDDKERKKTASEDKKQPNDDTYAKKVKELKIKEDYLKEKEKFLIEKEHDLLQKEIKLNKEKHHGKNKHDKKSYHKKEKEYKDDSSEQHDKKSYHKKEKECEQDSSQQAFSERKAKKYKPNNEHDGVKNDKKYEYKEEKKRHPTQKGHRFSHEENKKRNISGQWYTNLHEGRDSMRQKKRASFKKNKANWYFQWMVDRARLRVK